MSNYWLTLFHQFRQRKWALEKGKHKLKVSSTNSRHQSFNLLWNQKFRRAKQPKDHQLMQRVGEFFGGITAFHAPNSLTRMQRLRYPKINSPPPPPPKINIATPKITWTHRSVAEVPDDTDEYGSLAPDKGQVGRGHGVDLWQPTHRPASASGPSSPSSSSSSGSSGLWTRKNNRWQLRWDTEKIVDRLRVIAGELYP